MREKERSSSVLDLFDRVTSRSKLIDGYDEIVISTTTGILPRNRPSQRRIPSSFADWQSTKRVKTIGNSKKTREGGDA